MEQDPGGFEIYSRGKALVVLYDFHALLFPSRPVHIDRLEEPEQDYEFVPRDADYPPEAPLTDRNLAIMAKVEIIRQQFRGMLRHRAENIEDAAAYDFVVALCEDARLSFRETEEDLTDETGRPMASYEILPPPVVINAMVGDFILRRRQHCEPLEEYIAQLQAPET